MPVIAAALAEAEPEGWTVIDCPPGSACPVMESAREADYRVLVSADGLRACTTWEARGWS
ncbi:MAG: hypothetical protein ACLUEK_08860 [Oscillospiraceae bacterium]